MPVQGEFDPSIFRFAERIVVVEDRDSRPVLLTRSAFDIDRALDKNPELELSEVADPHLFDGATIG